MIEYMSAVILTGCGTEVWATSKTTKHSLRRQAGEENGGHLRIESACNCEHCGGVGK